jgi:transposase InsO family protein
VFVRESHERSRKTYGSLRARADLGAQGKRVSRKGVIRLMQQQDIKARARRRYRSTTMSEHGQPVAPNLPGQRLLADAPDKRWAGDTERNCASATAVASSSRRSSTCTRAPAGLGPLGGKHPGARHSATPSLPRLRAAAPLRPGQPPTPATTTSGRARLAASHAACAPGGNCYDNAATESCFSTFKNELGESFESYASPKERASDYIDVFDNEQRRHSTIGYLATADFERRRLPRSRTSA